MKGQLLVKQRQQAKLLTEKLTGTEINLEQTETETFDLLSRSISNLRKDRSVPLFGWLAN